MKSNRGMTKWTVVLVAGALGAWGGSAEAHSQNRTLIGGLTTHQVPCATLCTAGDLTGSLAGQLAFTMTTMTETEVPDVFFFTGVNVITTPHGTLTGTDHGVWNVATGEFVDYTTFSSATGAYRGKTGSLTIAGKFDPVAGAGQSHYKAVLRRP